MRAFVLAMIRSMLSIGTSSPAAAVIKARQTAELPIVVQMVEITWEVMHERRNHPG
jgi:hypothetical protein